jgi:hypothetical protein
MTCYLSRLCNVPVPTESVKAKKIIFVGLLKSIDEKSRIRIRNSVYGSKDPDSSHNVTDQEHCLTQ